MHITPANRCCLGDRSPGPAAVFVQLVAKPPPPPILAWGLSDPLALLGVGRHRAIGWCVAFEQGDLTQNLNQSIEEDSMLTHLWGFSGEGQKYSSRISEKTTNVFRTKLFAEDQSGDTTFALKQHG